MSEVDAIRRRYRAACVAAVRTFTEDVGGEAQRRAPIDEGPLRASEEVDVDVTGDLVTGTVSFNEVYAARQHEEDEWEHPKGGQADYLGSVMRERAHRLEGALAAATRKVL